MAVNDNLSPSSVVDRLLFHWREIQTILQENSHTEKEADSPSFTLTQGPRGVSSQVSSRPASRHLSSKSPDETASVSPPGPKASTTRLAVTPSPSPDREKYKAVWCASQLLSSSIGDSSPDEIMFLLLTQQHGFEMAVWLAGQQKLKCRRPFNALLKAYRRHLGFASR